MLLFQTSISRLLPSELCTLIRVQSQSLLHIHRPLNSAIRTFSTSNPSLTTPNASTVDPIQLSHFASLASSWWDPYGPSRLLHLMNPLRHTFIKSALSSAPTPIPNKLNYLDIGCGGGIFAESAARLRTTSSVTALDPSPSVISVAKEHMRQDPLLLQPEKLTYLNCSIEDLANRKECRQDGYDIVTLFEVLEHVASPSTFLSHILPHVKPGGWLILSTIARTWTSWAVTKVLAEDVLGMVPRGTHEWRKYVNEEELREWFGKRDGWEGVRSIGVVYVPGLGWREVPGSERVGNYFFGVRKE